MHLLGARSSVVYMLTRGLQGDLGFVVTGAGIWWDRGLFRGGVREGYGLKLNSMRGPMGRGCVVFLCDFSVPYIPDCRKNLNCCPQFVQIVEILTPGDSAKTSSIGVVSLSEPSPSRVVCSRSLHYRPLRHEPRHSPHHRHTMPNDESPTTKAVVQVRLIEVGGKMNGPGRRDPARRGPVRRDRFAPMGSVRGRRCHKAKFLELLCRAHPRTSPLFLIVNVLASLVQTGKPTARGRRASRATLLPHEGGGGCASRR